MIPDGELLRRYTETDSESAFTELVERHLALVYSAALRQVNGDAHLAQDVAQTVFADLAGKAATLAGRPVLTGWLYTSALFAAAKAVRTEQRRHTREQEAHLMNHLLCDAAPDTDWEKLRPVLDAAMLELNETDREAVLLRYFGNRPHAEIADRLGLSENAARMRVERALDKLHALLSSRGVSTTAALSAVISANAVQVAPAGLAATLSTAALAGTTLATATTATAVKTITMTTLQKTLITATLVAAVGTGIYEAREASNLRDQVQKLLDQQTVLAEHLQKQRDNATNRLAGLLAENERLKSNQSTTELLRLRGEVGRLRTGSNDPNDVTAKALVAKMNKLKQRLEETPNAKIPELQFLTEEDWLNIASAKLDTDVDFRRAMAALRNAGESKFAAMLHPALSQYLQANGGKFPTELGQLVRYFTSPVDETILQRWEITSPKTVSNLGVGTDGIITQKTPVDDIFDSRIAVGSSGYGAVDFLSTQTQDLLIPVYKAFATANGGLPPTDLSQVLPYATTSEQQAALQKLIFRASNAK